MTTGSKGHQAVHACMIRLETLGPAKHEEEAIALTAGVWLRISPAAKRQFFAAEDAGISFVCIQTKENSLGGFTADDAVVY